MIDDILDLKGKLLYQVWHDGALSARRWLSDVGLLVLAGCHNDADWEKRGYPRLADGTPRVVFAIRPELGLVTEKYVSTLGHLAHQWPFVTNSAVAASYLCSLFPPPTLPLRPAFLFATLLC